MRQYHHHLVSVSHIPRLSRYTHHERSDQLKNSKILIRHFTRISFTIIEVTSQVLLNQTKFLFAIHFFLLSAKVFLILLFGPSLNHPALLTVAIISGLDL